MANSANVELCADMNEQEIEYQSLYNALYWTEGFGLFFVQCTPAQGGQLIARLTVDMLHDKQAALLHLDSKTYDLVKKIQQVPDVDNIDILFISGIENSLTDYIKPGYGGQGCYYKEDSIPRVLGFLNLARERLRVRFNHLSFVFLLPNFGVKYCIRRAKDFFDWNAGLFHFSSEQPCYQPPPKINEKPNRNFLKCVKPSHFSKEATSFFNLGALLALSSLYIGEALSLLRKYEFALVFYKKAIFFNPKHPKFWNAYGKTLDSLGYYQLAISQFDKALAINPINTSSWCNRGYSLIQQQHYEQAIASFDKALKTKPYSIHSWLGRGQALRQLKCYQEAEEAYKQALILKPSNREAQNGNALVDHELTKIYETLMNDCEPSKLDKLCQENPNNCFVLKQSSFVHLSKKQYKKAGEKMDKAAKSNPNDETVWLHSAMIMKNLECYELAIKHCSIATAINPSNRIAWDYQGSTLEQINCHPEAIHSYGESIHNEIINDKCVNTHKVQQCHQLFKKIGKPEAIKASCSALLAIFPNDASLWYQQGEYLAESGENEEARDSFAKTVKLEPSNEWAWHKYGDVLEKLGQYEEAIAKYDKAIELNTVFESVWHKKINCLQKLGSYEDAVKACYQAMKANPAANWARYNDLFEEAERYEDQLWANFKQETTEKPKDAHVWYKYGCLFAQINDYKQSLVCFNNAIEIKPNEINFLYSRCQVLEKLVRYDEMLLDCDKILRIYLKQLELKPYAKLAFAQIADVVDKIAKYYQDNAGLLMNLGEGKKWDNLGRSLRKSNQLNIAAKVFEQGLYFFPSNLYILTNDLELALLQEDKQRVIKRFETARPLIKPDDQTYVLVPFLRWLAEPDSDWKVITKAIQKLDKQTEFSWDANDVKLVIKRLNASQRQVANIFVDFFEKKRAK